MQRGVELVSLAFLALGAMFSLTPQSNTVRSKVLAKDDCRPSPDASIAGYFEETWGYIEHGLEQEKTVK